MGFAIVDGLRTLEIGTPGAMRERLNRLILDGHKRATAGLLLDYVREDEELETEGQLLALVDDESQRVATVVVTEIATVPFIDCLLYTSPSPRDRQKSRMPSSA